MTIYRFEIQSCVSVDVCANSPEDARQLLVNNPNRCKRLLGDNDYYISEGYEVKTW